MTLNLNFWIYRLDWSFWTPGNDTVILSMCFHTRVYFCSPSCLKLKEKKNTNCFWKMKNKMEINGNCIYVHISIFVFSYCLYLKDFILLGKWAFLGKTEMKVSADWNVTLPVFSCSAWTRETEKDAQLQLRAFFLKVKFFCFECQQISFLTQSFCFALPTNCFTYLDF